LNETQIDSLFICPTNKLKGKSEWSCELYATSIGYLSTKLNKRQLGNVFECLNGLKDEHKCIRVLCKKSLETISTKLNDKQLDRVFSAFIHGLKDLDKWVCISCAELLEVILEKLNEIKQALIAKAKIYAIQNGAFIVVTNQPTKYIFNCTLIQLNEFNAISFINLTFPNLFKVLKRLIMNGSDFILIVK
ncbi:hypothetical protein RFI_33998, partial [Reticulomyxa filosa]